MSFEKTPLRGVTAQYGARKAERAMGNMQSAGAKVELVLDLNADSVTDGLAVADIYIPKGSLIVKAFVEVEEAFALTGTSPAIVVGTEGSEATNGLVVNEATAEAVGTVDITSTLTGTWASSLAADTKVGFGLSGTSPAATNGVGKARVVVEYLKV